MFKVEIRYEGNKSMKKIADEFKDQLSEEQIKKTAAYAVNITARRVMTLVRKEVKKDYTISNKYLERMTKLSKPASSSSCFATVSYGYSTLPMIAFKHKSLDRNPGFVSYHKKIKGVQMEVKKGKTFILKHSFIKSMVSGHVGVWSHGRYLNGKFVASDERTPKNKPRITQIKTASPFTMYTSDKMDKRVLEYVDKNLTERFKALLQQKVNKLK